ncbi:MAG: monovalent cation/H+ antiporter complex subunit F [Pseudomonadota bacterium]
MIFGEGAASFLAWSVQIGTGLMLLGVVIVFIRIIKGPSLADRALALDLMLNLGMGLIALTAIRTAYYAYLDVAIALGLVGFLATAAFARFIIHRRVRRESEDD